MSSPVTLHIEPIKDLEIIADFAQIKDHSKKDIPYRIEYCSSKKGFPISKTKERHLYNSENEESCYFGVLSPLSNLTLPSKRKELAGIPKSATKYAYMYPPKDLAKVIKWVHIQRLNEMRPQLSARFNKRQHDSNEGELELQDHRYERQSLRDSLQSEYTYNWPNSPGSSDRNLRFLSRFTFRIRKGRNKSSLQVMEHALPREWYLACLSVLGAYVYFEEKKDSNGKTDYKLLSTNILCFVKDGAGGELRMDGPFDTDMDVVHYLKTLDRFQVLPSEQFHECGYVAKVIFHLNFLCHF